MNTVPPPPEASGAGRLRHYLLTGLFVTVPLGLTVLTILWFVTVLDNTMAPFVAGVLGRRVPGLGLVATFFIVLGAGWLASNVVGQALIELLERLFLRIPGFNWLYRTIKQVVEAFSPESRLAFGRTVIVEYPKAGAYSFGFVTKDFSIDWADGRADEMLSVYIPTNHFYFGNYVMFKRSQVLATHLTVQEGIQCALSAGATIPDRLRPEPPHARNAD